MRIVQINATCGIGSTGKICVGISRALTEAGVENHILCSKSNGYPLGIPCASPNYTKVQASKSRIAGNYGFQSRRETKRIMRELDRLNPDVVHLHNIHGHDCDLDLLFSYFKEHGTKLVWTFHDCWAFTAYCPYFTKVRCDKWKTGCEDCPQYRNHSFFFDRSKQLYRKKRELLTGLDLTVVTPSQWLADLVKESFLKQYPVTVINNGIDLSVFGPRESDFREKHRISSDKHILLGVAFDWEERKGLDVFLKLAETLDADKYQIVLVGTDDAVDKQLSPRIISIHRTQNQQELAEVYSAADLFLIPTREDNYPTVNMEALACGTPVLTFRTGGSPEMLDETCGSVVPCDDVEVFQSEVLRICGEKPFSSEQCIKRAQGFDQNVKFREYVELYKKLLSLEK